MQTATQIQLSEVEIQRLEAGELVKIAANWEEFMDFLEETPYKAEFANNEITIMGLAILLHEWLVGQMCWILKNFYLGQANVLVLGSNLGVSRPDVSYFNPDVTVMKDVPEFYRKSKAIIKNPYLVVEILSESTAKYDSEIKLPRYQKMTSVQVIVLIDPKEKEITVVNRTADPKVWLMSIYDQPTDAVVIDGNTLPLASFFEGMPVFA